MIRATRSAVPLLLLATGLLISPQPGWAQGPQFNPRLGVSAPASENVRQDDRPSKKEPGTATIISILIVGGGQIYSGETTRGLLMLGGAYGALIVGAAMSTCGDTDFTCSTTPLAIGAVAFLGIYVYNIIDAASSARRMNKKNGYKVSAIAPVLRVGPGGMPQLGVSVAF